MRHWRSHAAPSRTTRTTSTVGAFPGSCTVRWACVVEAFGMTRRADGFIREGAGSIARATSPETQGRGA